MTCEQFRSLALSIPGAVESAHMDHPDFRVQGRVFGSLGYPDEKHGMVKLPPAQQKRFIDLARDVFSPCNGAWGRGGATAVHLPSATVGLVRQALQEAAGNIRGFQLLPKAKERKATKMRSNVKAETDQSE